MRLDEAPKVHVGLLCVTADGLSWLPEAVGHNELGGYKNKAKTVARRKGGLSLSLPLSQTIPIASSYSSKHVNATLCPV